MKKMLIMGLVMLSSISAWAGNGDIGSSDNQDVNCGPQVTLEEVQKVVYTEGHPYDNGIIYRFGCHQSFDPAVKIFLRQEILKKQSADLYYFLIQGWARMTEDPKNREVQDRDVGIALIKSSDYDTAMYGFGALANNFKDDKLAQAAIRKFILSLKKIERRDFLSAVGGSHLDLHAYKDIFMSIAFNDDFFDNARSAWWFAVSAFPHSPKEMKVFLRVINDKSDPFRDVAFFALLNSKKNLDYQKLALSELKRDDIQETARAVLFNMAYDGDGRKDSNGKKSLHSSIIAELKNMRRLKKYELIHDSIDEILENTAPIK